MVAMLFTAISYGRMARAYPSAGSAYTYVGRELHPALGLPHRLGHDLRLYLEPDHLRDLVQQGRDELRARRCRSRAGRSSSPRCSRSSTCEASRQARAPMSGSPRAWALVIVLFFAAAVRTIFRSARSGAGRFLLPFYDPSTFSWSAVSTGTSIAMLTYIGFDGISTLSEEAHNPRRNILLATVLTCLVTGVLAASQVYAAQLVWPRHEGFPDVDTAFVYIAGQAGGPALFFTVNLALLVATVGSGAGSHLAAGRLLYGMGRDNAIPSRFFGALDPRTQIPRNNILLVGGLALIGAFSVSYQLGAELLNFGAFIGFMGVNLAAFVRYYLRADKTNLPQPGAAAARLRRSACTSGGVSDPLAKLAGLAWLAAGLALRGLENQGISPPGRVRTADEFVLDPSAEESSWKKTDSRQDSPINRAVPAGLSLQACMVMPARAGGPTRSGDGKSWGTAGAR